MSLPILYHGQTSSGRFFVRGKDLWTISGDDLQGSENDNGHADTKAEKSIFAQRHDDEASNARNQQDRLKHELLILDE